MTDKSPESPAPSGARGEETQSLSKEIERRAGAEMLTRRDEVIRDALKKMGETVASRPAPQAQVTGEMVARATEAARRHFFAGDITKRLREAIPDILSAALAVPPRRVGREEIAKVICRMAHLKRFDEKYWRAGELDTKVEAYWRDWLDVSDALLALISGEQEG